jgi:serine/threonine protein kinase
MTITTLGASSKRLSRLLFSPTFQRMHRWMDQWVLRLRRAAITGVTQADGQRRTQTMEMAKVPLEEARGQVGAYRLSAVLMDFGIVKWLEGTASMVGTLTSGGMIGTVDYVAPEQITAAHDVDSRADIYALGMMAYLMMTGRLPFKGSVGQVVYAHLQQTPPDPHLINPALPVRAADAIVRALAKVPESRFRTAGEFAAALRLGMRTA